MTRLIYVCHVFPWVTQTFTTREVDLLKREGIDVQVFAFREPSKELLDDRARSLLSSTTYIPSLWSLGFIGPVLRATARHPWGVARSLLRGAFAPYLAHTTIRLRGQGVFDALRGAWIGEMVCGHDVHLHAEFAENAATAALVSHELSGATFSFKSHSSFNPQLLRQKTRAASFVALATEFDRSFYFPSVSDGRIIVNRLGVEPADVVERDEELSAPGALLCVATLAEKKGHRYLIEAAARLRDKDVSVRILLVGDGPLRPKLEQLVSTYELESVVTFRRYVPHSELQSLYASADVFVLPAVVTPEGDRDGLPVVLMEALAAGCIVISTPVSGIPELIVEGVSGLLVPERDADALASAIEIVTGDAELRRTLRVGGRRVLKERFDLERNVRELAEAFRQAASSGIRSSTSR
jgi:colanic acid/amylovoran biosynthesis glycosyltransferase